MVDLHKHGLAITEETMNSALYQKIPKACQSPDLDPAENAVAEPEKSSLF